MSVGSTSRSSKGTRRNGAIGPLRSGSSGRQRRDVHGTCLRRGELSFRPRKDSEPNLSGSRRSFEEFWARSAGGRGLGHLQGDCGLSKGVRVIKIDAQAQPQDDGRTRPPLRANRETIASEGGSRGSGGIRSLAGAGHMAMECLPFRVWSRVGRGGTKGWMGCKGRKGGKGGPRPRYLGPRGRGNPRARCSRRSARSGKGLGTGSTSVGHLAMCWSA